MIDFKGEVADSSEETMLSNNAAALIVALSTVDSIVVPSLDLQGVQASAHTTTVRLVEPSITFGSSVCSKDFDTVGSITTDLQQNRSALVNMWSTHYALELHHTTLSVPHSTRSFVHNDTNAENNSNTSSSLTMDATDHTAPRSYTEARELRTSAVLNFGDGTERSSAQATKSRGQAHLPVVTTEASSTLVTHQTLEKSRYGDVDGSTIAPYGNILSAAHPPRVSLTPAPQTTICSSGPWNISNLSNTHTRTDAATNESSSVPSMSPSAPPTFASTGHIPTSRYIWVLTCLWAISLLRI